MSLVPAFDIGVWNAWILMLYFPLHPLVMIAIDKLVGVGNITKKMGEAPYTEAEKKIFKAAMVVMAVAFIYSIFLPLKLGTPWLYIGLLVYLLGLVMWKISIINIATTPHGQPFTAGAYRFSRHPMIFWGNIMHLGISIATASWVFMLLSIAAAVLFHYTMVAEERGCLGYYGDAYRDYMDKTPRWIGLPGS